MDIDQTKQVATETVGVKREKKDITFAAPVYAKQVFTEEGKKNYDSLPSWQRHLIKRLIEHGDLERAAAESNVSTYVKKTIDIEGAEKQTIIEALNQGGIDNRAIVSHISECLEAKTIRFDNHQNAIPCTDLNLKLKTIDLICKLKGLFETNKPGDKPKSAIDLFEDTPVG